MSNIGISEYLGRPLRLLVGGSPCTKWSIAQNSNSRETKAEGEGWELFKNYLYAKEKFKPDYFLYENNKSAAQSIKDQISKELNVELQYINSALVSAQNRQRFYAHNIPNVPLPEDRGILLKDILESGAAWQEKSYALTTRCQGAIISDTLKRHRHTMIAEPVRIGDIGTNAQAHRVYSCYGKSVNLIANAGGQGGKTGLYFTPIYPFSEESMEFDLYNSDSDVITHEDGNIAINGKLIYRIREKKISCKNVVYDIDLPDGYYTIRKLTPTECERLQTLPDGYTEGISATQRYRCLGNGWTAEVIIHILKHMNLPKEHPIEVLSLYDGIATGRYCLDALGYKNVIYKAYEIDKYPMIVALKNYPDIVESGDAFQLRDDNWKY